MNTITLGQLLSIIMIKVKSQVFVMKVNIKMLLKTYVYLFWIVKMFKVQNNVPALALFVSMLISIVNLKWNCFGQVLYVICFTSDSFIWCSFYCFNSTINLDKRLKFITIQIFTCLTRFYRLSNHWELWQCVRDNLYCHIT